MSFYSGEREEQEENSDWILKNQPDERNQRLVARPSQSQLSEERERKVEEMRKRKKKEEKIVVLPAT